MYDPQPSQRRRTCFRDAHERLERLEKVIDAHGIDNDQALELEDHGLIDVNVSA